MNDPAPISDDELAEIRRRTEAVTVLAPWESFIEGRDHQSGDDFIRTGGLDSAQPDMYITLYYGTALPIGKGPGTRSDIDYLVPPSSYPYFRGLDQTLPSLGPEGVIPGFHNPFIGPGIRFEPGTEPRGLPPAR